MASLGLAWVRIFTLQRFDPRWTADMHWALEVVSWPFVALLGAIIFSMAATIRQRREDRWSDGATFGAALALLIAAPTLLGAVAGPPLASWLTWVLVVVVSVVAGGGSSRRQLAASA